MVANQLCTKSLMATLNKLDDLRGGPEHGGPGGLVGGPGINLRQDYSLFRRHEASLHH